MVVNGRPVKRLKRRVTADLCDFLTFPVTDDEFAGVYEGPFRTNVKAFLSKHARLPPPLSLFSPSAVPHLLTWQIAFRIGDVETSGGADSSSPAPIVSLDVVEEDVTRSRSVYCDQCRVVGWSGHPVCGKRYHFIIRSDNRSVDGHQQACTRCGALLLSLDSRCKTCNYEFTPDDHEDWAYLQLEDSTHLLHGVVHANGYGHLLRVNGREGGSKFLSGSDIMDFWDRLCKMLRVRKVSVMDVSKKYGMEFRLLHAVTKGQPWYGNWGYEFGAGSFGLTLDAYQTAVKVLMDMPLSPFFTHGRGPRSRLQDIVAFYWSLSEHRLETVRDLFRFIMSLMSSIHKQAGVNGKRPGPGQFSLPLCLWSEVDVSRVEAAMIKVLRAVGRCHWVSWRALRGAVCRAGPPELLDYCLKLLGGRSFDGMHVEVQRNPKTDVVEYRLSVGTLLSVSIPQSDAQSCLMICEEIPNCPSEVQLLRDLKFLHDALLYPQTMSNYGPRSTRDLAFSSAVKLLDCKQFLKHYDSQYHTIPNPFAIQLLCQVDLIDQPKDYTVPPPEHIVLPITATVGDLKREATIAFQDAYILFRRFQAEQLLDYGHLDDSTQVKLLVGLKGSVRVRGRCHSIHSLYRFRMERGTDNWIVDCTCGAKDDDGERMLACDSCGVWQHTRCAGVPDTEVVSARFSCVKCGGPSPAVSMMGSRCSDDLEAVSVRNRFSASPNMG
ncbi:PHD finger protein At1g33420-like [Aristolochia californica]|uniref:PHD finger protein At1g33420-like n=1 Tax=Aristolochia californica TaxID=171875 RepID=UPI0035D5E4A2